MKEREQTERVRRRILETAKKLFVAQGYEKTTIRQMVEKSGIASGSIYHLFKNKEEVFQAEIEELMERCVEEINGRFPREDGLAKYIAVWALETHAIATSPILREIFYHAYTSDTMFEKLLDRHVLLLARFDVRLPPEKDARIRVTLLGGAMRGYIASFAFAKPFDESAFRSELLAMVMNALGASPKTQAAIWRTLENRDGEWKEIAAVLLR